VEPNFSVEGGKLGESGMFADSFQHTLDEKSRVTIPIEWRRIVGVPERLFVMPDPEDPCLCAYPARNAQRIQEKVRAMTMADGKGRRYARMLGSRSEWLAWDGQGRVRIKDELLQFAGITSSVVLVGTIEYFELWSPERWQQIKQSETQSSLGDAVRYIGC
jgi:MraZ protein